MPRTEKLPTGFEILPSQAIRVKVRLKGHAPAVRTFPIFSATSEALREQMAEAKAWAETTRRDLLGGTILPDRAAQTTTVGDVLKRYALVGLKGTADN